MAWLAALALSGTLGLASYLMARHGLRQPAGWPRTLGAVVLAWAWCTLGMEVLGALGLLAVPPLLCGTAALLVAGLVLRGLDRSRGRDEPPPTERASIEGSAILALGLVIWAALYFGVRSLAQPVKVYSDGPIYHLYFAARWWKAGRIFLIATPFGENAATYFPAVGDLWFTWLVVGWGGDLPAKVGQAPFLLAAGMAAYALARRLGAGRSPALLATCWFVASTPLMLFAFEPNVDAIFTAGYLLAAYFFLRYALGDDGLPALALGALAAGGALGTKPTGVVFVPLLLLLAVVARIIPRSVSEPAPPHPNPPPPGGREQESCSAAITEQAHPGSSPPPGGREQESCSLPPGGGRPGWGGFRGRPGPGNASAAVSSRRPWRHTLAAVGLAAALPMVMAGYWFGRNALLTGNPLYPLRVEAFGKVWLPGWYGPGAMRWGKFYLPVWHWRGLADTLLAVLDPRLSWLWLAALAGAWSWGRSRQPWRGWVWGLSALAVVNVALYWVCIPYRTQQRFMLHALGLAVAPLALTLGRSRWLRWGAVVLLGLHVLTHQDWPFAAGEGRVPWDFTPLIPGANPGLILWPHRGSSPKSWWGDPVALGPLLTEAAVAAAIAWAWCRSVGSEHRGRRGLASALTVAGVALSLAVAWPSERDPRLRFYPFFPDHVQGWLTLDRLASRTGARVAYSGTNLPYYLLGVGLRNEVRYVNINAHPGWLLHDYHRDADARGLPPWPIPRPGWDRLDRDYNAWLSNLRAARIQLLFVTRADFGEGPHNVADRQGFPIERVWADAHPEAFEPVYGVQEHDPFVRIYRVRPTRTDELGIEPPSRQGRQERAKRGKGTIRR